MNADKTTSPEEITIDEATFNTAQAEAENSTNLFVYKFPKPWTWEGKTYESLTFDYEKCKGKDLLAVANELKSLGRPVVVKAMDDEFCIRLAARMCTETIGVDVILEMPGKAFDVIEGSARRFLLRSE